MTAKSLGVKKTAELDTIKSLPKTETIRSISIFREPIPIIRNSTQWLEHIEVWCWQSLENKSCKESN